MEGRGRGLESATANPKRRKPHPPPIFAWDASCCIALRHGNVPGSAISSCGRLLLCVARKHSPPALRLHFKLIGSNAICCPRSWT